MTHAFFKALLFLGAGSVIMGMHHDQDMRNMGGLRKYMPITWITSLIGSLALIGTPFFSGFYSKDSIIEAVAESHIYGSGFAYFAVMAGVFITAFYSFRMYFLVFHGKERFGHAHDAHGDHHEHHGLAPGQKPHESPLVVTLPLILLAIPSVIIGYIAIEPMLYGGFFDQSILIDAKAHPAMEELEGAFHGAFNMVVHSLTSPVLWLAIAGVATAAVFYLIKPEIPAKIAEIFTPIKKVLDNKYYLDDFNQAVFGRGAQIIGNSFWKIGDQTTIDGFIVNGSAKVVDWFSKLVRHFQSGYLYHYAFAMIIGVVGLIAWILFTHLGSIQ
jgi:NADH-quinone oxidoreductase subunit L